MVDDSQLKFWLRLHFDCYWLDQDRPRDRRFDRARTAIIPLEDYYEYCRRTDELETKVGVKQKGGDGGAG